MDDFYRAYAYFRWADDIVDAPALDDEERLAFIRQQRQLLDSLYSGEPQATLSPHESLLAELVNHDRGHAAGKACVTGGGLRSFIENMFAIIEFDAFRKGRTISREELDWYTESLGRSVTDGIQYFIANGHAYPESSDRFLAAQAAHVSHLLRDTMPDTAEGFYNIPREYIDELGIEPYQLDSPAYRNWVRQRVAEARSDFQGGKRYLEQLDVLRCKLAAYLYCTRFEDVLAIIEHDDFTIRPDYRSRGARLASMGSMSLVLIRVGARHFANRLRSRG